MASIINSTTTAGVTVTGDNSGSLQLATNNGTTAVTIDTSQNVGINITSPSYKLDVQRTANNGTGVLDVLRLRSTADNADDGPRLLLTCGNSTTGGAGIGAGGVALNSANLLFYAGGNTERMRIDSSGFVGINATPVTSGAVSGRLFVSTSANNGICSTATVAAGYRFVSNALSESGTFYHLNIVENGTQRGSITSNGSVTVYATTSDYRLKENVKPMVGALGAVAQLKPVTYDWIESKSKGQGFIAHELQAVIPDAVVGVKDAVDSEDNPKYQQIDTSVLVATLTASIQELNAKVDAQAVRIAELEGAR